MTLTRYRSTKNVFEGLESEQSNVNSDTETKQATSNILKKFERMRSKIMALSIPVSLSILFFADFIPVHFLLASNTIQESLVPQQRYMLRDKFCCH